MNHTVKTHLASYFESDQLGYGRCDLRDTANIREQVAAAAKYLGGRIDVLVNNGAIAPPHWKDGKTMADLSTLEEWQA